MRFTAPGCLASTAAMLALLGFGTDARADRTLGDYKYFRALSIDLRGRIPTGDEITAFERPDFDVDAWIDQQTSDPANDQYAERLTRVYMDLMRLRVGSSFIFRGRYLLHRQQVLVENPTDPTNPRIVNVLYRRGQRRTAPHSGTRPTTVEDPDGDFCFLPSEAGVVINQTGGQVGTRTPIPLTVFNAHVQQVYPWWLYHDDRAATPSDAYDPTTWATRYPLFVPSAGLLTEPVQHGETMGARTTFVYVCREEAQSAAMGHVMLTGRTTSMAPPYSNGRIARFPLDLAWARANPTATVDCNTDLGVATSADCGCGPGLEFCLPGADAGIDPVAFAMPSLANEPMGTENPIDSTNQQESAWLKLWWAQEARHFFDAVFTNDADFRDVLTAHYDYVNGPLAQFYRYIAATGVDASAAQIFGLTEPTEPLFDPAALPTDDPAQANALRPQDTGRWVRVANRGPHSSGILTMPIFLSKFGSRRARAHVLYNAFYCQDFVASANLQLTASTEPNLMVRQGCRDCHSTLEPMAAYFSRVMESDWSYLAPSVFPETNTHLCATGTISATCDRYYDQAFLPLGHGAVMRGAYPDLTDPAHSPGHADAGPAGLAHDIVNDARFAPCVASNIAGSFLGRTINPVDDHTLIDALTQAFVGDGSPQHGYRMRTLVRALVRSDAYRHGNDLDSNSWRDGGGL